SGVGDSSARPLHLEKNRQPHGMDLTRSIIDLRDAHVGDVDQRTDHLRLFVPWDSLVSIVGTQATRLPSQRVVRLVAMVCLARNFSSLGDGWRSVGSRFFRPGCGTRIRRALRRSGASAAAALFLFAASAPQICPVERVDDRNRNCRSSLKGVEARYVISGDVAGNILVGLLEFRRLDRDVADSFETRGPNFSGGAAALSAARRAGWKDLA